MEQRPAPPPTLHAVGSGRVLNLAEPGVATVLICFSQDTQKGIELLESAIRTRWPDAATVLVGHVIDLRKVPGMFRKIAEGVLSNEHRKAVADLPDRQARSPDDYVIMFADWSGEVAEALAIANPNSEMSYVVLSKSGRVVAACPGDGRERELVEAVEKALAEE